MIELEITSPHDTNINGAYLSFADKLVIGRGLQADLIVDDQQIISKHLLLEINQNQLKATPLEGATFWQNGKKNVAPRNLKLGDQLRLGETQFKILNFILSPKTNSSSANLEERYIQVIKTDPARKEILEGLKEELQRIKTGGSSV